jgi:hypothetical protein
VKEKWDESESSLDDKDYGRHNEWPSPALKTKGTSYHEADLLFLGSHVAVGAIGSCLTVLPSV